MSDFVVVGGGIGGLVAARRLAMGGASVTLVEASDRLGGTVARHTVGGIVLDAGAESFATRGNTVADLAAELGLHVVHPATAPAWLQRGADAFPLPATSLLGIPGVPLAQDVIDVVGTRTALRASLEVLLPAGRGARSETLGELVRARMGNGMLEKLVAPIAYGIHSAHPDALKLDRVAPGLRKALASTGSLTHAVLNLRAQAPAGSAVAGIRGGVHRLVEELASDLDRFHVDVRLGTTDYPTDGRLVWAAPDPSADVATRVTLVTLVLDAPELDAAPRGNGVLVAEGTPVRARALTHSTAKWPWLAERVESGRHVVRLSYSTPPGRPADVALADASVLLGVPLSATSVLDSDVVQWTRAAARIEFEDGVAYVGEATAGTGLANVIAQATTTADTLLA
jgi:protoporphyrinogen/coproporphyrinogen III oxidase